MNKLFENFANGNTEVTSKDSKIGANMSIQFGGEITIVKGGLSQRVSFWAQVSQMVFKGYSSIDDWEINERLETSFNGIPIDSLASLQDSLRNSGLSTIATSLEISNDDIGIQLATQIGKNKQFNKLFNKDTMWETLTKDEQAIIRLEHVVSKGEEVYEKMHVNNHSLKEYVTVEIIDEEEVKSKPTFEEIVSILEGLKNA